MLENERKQQELLDTTDCLEAVGTFKAMKNFLFMISFVCLLVLQASFWLLDRNIVGSDAIPKAAGGTVAEKERISAIAEEAARQLQPPAQPGVSQPTQTPPAQRNEPPVFYERFSNWAWLIRFCDFVLIVSAVLYSLTVLFSLKISLIGRLGGISHISRAFFLSLFTLVFVLPWQKFFGGVIAGAIYTPEDWLCASQPRPEQVQVLWAAVYYLRFVVLPVLVLVFLVLAQTHTVRWARATLRRLEVI
jgi:hypothetical protein